MSSDDVPADRVPTDTVTFPSGAAMPLLGFGTWQITGDDAVRATATALEAGYRHLDTATVYGNEKEVGRAIAESGLRREDVFVTTKCPPNRRGEELDTLRRSLDLLGLEHVDLWLVHWPSEDDATDLEIWRRFVEARDSALARDAGVSNFGPAQIDALTEATGTPPVVNQIKWSPLLFDANAVAAHRERDVTLEGYSALRGGTLDHPEIRRVADAHGRSTAQVIVRWHLQHGIVVIPKSENDDRIRANAEVADFELTDDEMASLDALGRS